MRLKILSMVLLLAALVAGSAWAQPPVGAASPSPLAMQNHYKCYDIISHDPFDPRIVRLRDQFGLTEAQVVRPVYHCNPVDKNDEGIPYPDVHLVCYEIYDNPYLGTWPLRIYNLNFGWLGIKADKARLLCAPSYKYHVPDGTDPGSDGK